MTPPNHLLVAVSPFCARGLSLCSFMLVAASECKAVMLLLLRSRLCPQLADGTRVVINLSGRGDKDVNTAAKHLDISG